MQETVTVEKDLAPGVHVRIEGVPAIFPGSSTERRHYFEVKTANLNGWKNCSLPQVFAVVDTTRRIALYGRARLISK